MKQEEDHLVWSTSTKMILGSLQLGYLHRDVKPDNFRKSSDDLLYLIDFGATAKFDESKVHINSGIQNKGTNFTSSIYVLKGQYALQIDDLISVLYSILFLTEPLNIKWQQDDNVQKIIDLKGQLSESWFQSLLCKKVAYLIQKLDAIRLHADVTQSINPCYDEIIKEIENVYAIRPLQDDEEQDLEKGLRSNPYDYGSFEVQQQNDIPPENTFKKVIIMAVQAVGVGLGFVISFQQITKR
ncbi:ck1 family protein kinase [Stylonychia lemnae]|uniref:Casein kinase I n=1 Tax=Stylonychia lemnae TaxID=5949 RepID=A0A078AK72_STYLE|nr:ck1 family protein kinase [Stylonychia lemnae]|eukprot:CDW82780.1 ck1 family protein kinase [Stylonychia lemnae]